LLFDKPYGWTSFDLVGKIRNILSRKLKVKKLKVGHAGTLDPLATGLMIVCTGKATKKVETLQLLEKEYVATLKTGATTPSFDMETPENAVYSTEHITRELVSEILRLFGGSLSQVPPAFSAVKIDGKRAYKHARKGNDPELQPRNVMIREIELLSFSLPEISIRVVCSKGTYIRALARDIGKALGSGAYLTALRRTRTGDFSVDNAFSMEEFQELLEK
jgi:tRNA pseudouridine55 synthase